MTLTHKAFDTRPTLMMLLLALALILYSCPSGNDYETHRGTADRAERRLR